MKKANNKKAANFKPCGCPGNLAPGVHMSSCDLNDCNVKSKNDNGQADLILDLKELSKSQREECDTLRQLVERQNAELAKAEGNAEKDATRIDAMAQSLHSERLDLQARLFRIELRIRALGYNVLTGEKVER